MGDEMSDDLLQFVEDQTFLFGFDTLHQGEDVAFKIQGNRLEMRTQSGVVYRTDRRMISDEHWRAVNKWYAKKQEKNEPPIIPKLYLEQLSSATVTRDESAKARTRVTKAEVHQSGQVNLICEKLDTISKLLQTIVDVQKKNTGDYMTDHLREMRKEMAKEKQRNAAQLQNITKMLEKLTKTINEPGEVGAKGRNEFDFIEDYNETEEDGAGFENEIAGIVKSQYENLRRIKMRQNSESPNSSPAKKVGKAVKLEFLNENLPLKRDYKLTSETRFEHFYDFFKSELRANKLLHVIDSAVDFKGDRKTLEEQKFRVRDILISHIDKNYRYKVMKFEDPVDILNKLRELKQFEENVTPFTGRKEISNMVYIKDQISAMEFCDKFEDAIRTYENTSSATPLSEEEKRDAFYNAVMVSVPLVQQLESTAQVKGERPLRYDQLKTLVQDEEVTRSRIEGANREVRLAKKSDRCFECGGNGHFGRDCLNKGMGKLCYVCNNYGHIAMDCSKFKGHNDNQKDKLKQTNYYGHNSRGFGRGDDGDFPKRKLENGGTNDGAGMKRRKYSNQTDKPCFTSSKPKGGSKTGFFKEGERRFAENDREKGKRRT
ncbi:uncharacterized protein LOC107035920 isoform X2 [Diachasma alloeum]|uniref:uncharacterized protein LOC107035920 isoform X2 n=1 Tax=Diachasma alloeum TaxID=454923 RepID=UPI0007383790|nr:uncharacterized protein LOC107035920 isoform X2 [Diachasma alloeum]